MNAWADYEAEETLRAIRNGEVDALVVHDDSPAAQVFTLSSADPPYRKFVENMRDGAATVSEAVMVAVRLESALRLVDSVSRLGGDEFVVLLPGMTSSADATTVTKRIASEIDVPIKLDGGAVALTASIGVSITAHTVSEHDINPEDLLQQADAAMYHAKSLGGSQTHVFDLRSTHGSGVESDPQASIGRLREALDEDRFTLHAQPIVELMTGKVVQQELLLRLRAP